MPKKIAVLTRDRQGEALRMSVGITVMDDQIDIFVLDRKIEETDENMMNLEMIKEMEMNLYTNNKENEGMEFLTTEEIARKLLEYDNILAY
jgi:hypothetical protein